MQPTINSKKGFGNRGLGISSHTEPEEVLLYLDHPLIGTWLITMVSCCEKEQLTTPKNLVKVRFSLKGFTCTYPSLPNTL